MDSSADVTLKTLVNTRASLESRVPKKKKEEGIFTNISLHHSKETTYDIDYIPQKADANKEDGSITYSGAFRDSSFGRGADGTNGSGAGANGNGSGEGDGAGNGLNGTGSVSGSGTGTGVGAGGDTQARNYIGSYKTVAFPTSMWESTAHAATRSVQPEQQLDFYSNVRKIEAKDDEARGGTVGSVQRYMEVATKRATDPRMQMPPCHYIGSKTPEFPLTAAHEKMLVRRNYLDLVECTHLDPDTEQQIGFNAQPETRLPGLDLSQEHSVQSKAITRMATSEELFRSYPKYTNDKIVTYAGHIPMHPRNVEAMHGGEDCRREWPKSIMTLATHGGGVDSTVSANSIRARMRRGKNAPALQMLKPKNDRTIRETMEGDQMQRTFYATTERERRINYRNDDVGHLYF